MEGHSVEHFGIMGIVQIENPPGTKSALKKMLLTLKDTADQAANYRTMGMNFKDEFLNMNYGDMAGRSYLAS